VSDDETYNRMTIEELIEASSLGSAGARALRARTPLHLRDQAAARIRDLIPENRKPPDARKPQTARPGAGWPAGGAPELTLPGCEEPAR
jgi:hypothetical protein